ncbi:MAG: reductase [Mycobacteriales bacterium]
MSDRLLVIGGGAFLGPAVVSAATNRGYQVTTLTRSGAGIAPGVESLLGDRETSDGLAVLEGREWDVVVDTCGYVPRVVGATANVLADSVGHYIFVSSISTYAHFGEGPIREGSPIFDCAADAGPDDGHYGELKAGCERAVLEHFSGRCTMARAGHIVGPGDNVGRLSYWLNRVAGGGEVLAPGPPERSLSMVDVRDLADWMIHCGRERVVGAMAASGMPGQTSYGELLGLAATVSGADPTVVWADDDFLLANDVEPWQDLPYWMPEREFPGAEDIDTSAAHAAGLVCRPVGETVRDTWNWLCSVGAPPQRADRPPPGLTPEREKEILEAWHRR